MIIAFKGQKVSSDVDHNSDKFLTIIAVEDEISHPVFVNTIPTTLQTPPITVKTLLYDL